MPNLTPPVSQFTLKKVSLLKRLGIYNTPTFIPVFFQSRSGSTVLGETISTHSHCLCLNEAFINYRGKQLPFTYNDFLKPPTEQYLYRHALKGKYLTHAFLQFNEWYYPIFNRNSASNEEVFTFIAQHFPGMVFIYRRNQLKRIVSNLRAKERGFWHASSKMPEQVEKSKFYFDVNKIYGDSTYQINGLYNYIHRSVTGLEKKLATARQCVPNLLELVYEDDIEPNVMIGVNKVLDHFNVPPSYQSMSVPLAKISRGLQHDIENFEEIKAYLANTPYAWMLED